MKRDNFAEPIKRALRERVAYRCSNPECRVPTVGPADGPVGVTRIGDAAHITAASRNGPRYDNSLTPEERKAIDNGIWLCMPCARKIDSQVDAHPVDLLRKWKTDAEVRAALEMGRPLPSEDSVRSEFVSALTGSPHLSSSLIPNAHGATAEALERLDPRFSVTTSYADGTTKITLRPNQPVCLSLHVGGDRQEEFGKGMDDLISKGEAVSIPTDAVRITGSQLVEHALDQHRKSGVAQLKFAAPRRSALMKLALLSPDQQILEPFDDVRGELWGGYKQVTFEGRTFDSLLVLRVVVQPEDMTRGDATFEIDTTHWDSCEVQSLPYFEDIERFVDLVSQGWLIDIKLKTKGKMAFAGRMKTNSDSFSSIQIMVTYILRVRMLAEILNQSFAFQCANVSGEDHELLHEYLKWGKPGVTHDQTTLAANPKMVLVAQDGAKNIRDLMSKPEPAELTYVEKESSVVVIFGETYTLPRRTVIMEGVTPRIRTDLSQVLEGEGVEIEWQPEEGFNWRVEYESPN